MRFGAISYNLKIFFFVLHLPYFYVSNINILGREILSGEGISQSSLTSVRKPYLPRITLHSLNYMYPHSFLGRHSKSDESNWQQTQSQYTRYQHVAILHVYSINSKYVAVLLAYLSSLFFVVRDMSLSNSGCQTIHYIMLPATLACMIYILLARIILHKSIC